MMFGTRRIQVQDHGQPGQIVVGQDIGHVVMFPPLFLSCRELTPDQARELAAALIATADEIEGKPGIAEPGA
ncbi:hypothetical protein [Chachezhania sediminis]|uniref:hypothetical protein n=1 Tax=Chachezhania sediminis TaxID=2599291 RepID=UPI00131C9A6C|nr:hypothetical protein [Chachezhania sediminis]